MNKIMIGILLIALCEVSACANTSSSDITSSQTDSVETITESTTEVIQYEINPILYPSLQDLVDASEIIVVGVVTSSSINRIDLTFEGNISGDTEMFANVSSFNVAVSKVIKGTIPSDMQLRVDLLCGGEVKGYIEIYEPKIPSPVAGEEYVFLSMRRRRIRITSISCISLKAHSMDLSKLKMAWWSQIQMVNLFLVNLFSRRRIMMILLMKSRI